MKHIFEQIQIELDECMRKSAHCAYERMSLQIIQQLLDNLQKNPQVINLMVSQEEKSGNY